MSGATDTCASCGVKHPTRRGMMVEHAHIFRAILSTNAAGPEDEATICTGSGKPSRELRDLRIAARRSRDRALVEAARGHAAIANDLLFAGASLPAEIDLPNLLELALVDLRLKQPTKARVPWLWARRGKQRGHRIPPHAVGDIYCRFCGDPLVMRVTHGVVTDERMGIERETHGGGFFARRVAPHTTMCALQVLSGLRTPVAPGTRKLPEEFRQDGEHTGEGRVVVAFSAAELARDTTPLVPRWPK